MIFEKIHSILNLWKPIWNTRDNQPSIMDENHMELNYDGDESGALSSGKQDG